MSDCIFCQIATGKIQGLRVFEDEKTLAIMDIAKDVDGHMLVIPKKHCKKHPRLRPRNIKRSDGYRSEGFPASHGKVRV